MDTKILNVGILNESTLAVRILFNKSPWSCVPSLIFLSRHKRLILWENENCEMEEVTTTDSVIIEGSCLSDDEEKIKVYGSTRLTTPAGPKSRPDDQSQVC